MCAYVSVCDGCGSDSACMVTGDVSLGMCAVVCAYSFYEVGCSCVWSPGSGAAVGEIVDEDGRMSDTDVFV